MTAPFKENVSFFRYVEEDKKLTELWLEEGVYTGQLEKGKPHGQVYTIQDMYAHRQSYYGANIQ
jgi:hypothetical protein